jgi:hypothetical protein
MRQILAWTLLTMALAMSRAHAATVLHFESEPGDYIGGERHKR